MSLMNIDLNEYLKDRICTNDQIESHEYPKLPSD